ncbi:MAG TPA: glycoside hydrolase family 38 C-terminal domain-containing protein [Actinocrinis sp.]|nr:glycoside hydrolase family 38 C-terminal domain-containing protein [Actinocrinis sp.]
MRIALVVSTDLFIGSEQEPRQVVRVEVDAPAGELLVRVAGAGVSGEARSEVLGEVGGGGWPVEVGVTVENALAGQEIPITVTVEASGGDRVQADGVLTVAEPGWTVWMVSHFHYDPVWWNTQAAYTTTWDSIEGSAQEYRGDVQQTGFDLIALHLETARREPEYKFVLAELDYLKPYWDAHPGDRAYISRLLAEGRLELMGGTYNEPSTNLTSAEATIRNLVYGVGFQGDVIGGDPRTAWQLDVFGHDPQFPGLVADAGLDSSSWARGPFHQWGPMLWTHEPREEGWGDPSTMQFSSEFEWVSPSGHGVLTHYMPAHYSAGWRIDSAPDLASAESAVYELFLLMKKVAATRNVLLPVGTDYTPPAKWVTDIHRDWAERYVWPRFVCALPREFFAAVRAQLAAEGRSAVAQTRDMNPVYTGKDVSFIDTKQAHRHAEALLIDAEKFATIAANSGSGAPYPYAALDKAWRQLLYGAHHDAITGSESDQVYLDLLTGWREAHDLARGVLDRALSSLAGDSEESGAGEWRGGDGAESESRYVTVFNPSSWPRTDLVRARVEFGVPGSVGIEGVAVFDDAGASVPVLLEHPAWHESGDGGSGGLASVDVVFLGVDVPAIGHRTWRVTGTSEATEIGWSARSGNVIENEHHRIVVDPARGGCVSEFFDKDAARQVLQDGRVGNELLVYEEYPAHPKWNEGPWHLVPDGRVDGSAGAAAESVAVSECAIGWRITVTGRIGPVRHTQELTLWHGLDRVDATTHVDEFEGKDQLLRVRWPVAIPGALPVSEVADAVVGRGFGLIDVDSASNPWTLDNPANHWFALSSTARVVVEDLDGRVGAVRALGIAEIVAADGVAAAGDSARELSVALVRQGVTATCSTGTGARYGRLAVDSNLPDVRIALGGPELNPFTAQVLAGAPGEYRAELERQLAAGGSARVWVPAGRPLGEVWVPGADLTGVDALPVLILADGGSGGDGGGAVGVGAVAALVADLEDAVVTVRQAGDLAVVAAAGEAGLDDFTVGMVNRGTPGFAVDGSGALHLSLLRSCTGWPSGVWIDPPRRTAPDGSNFQQQHWSHSFDYALVTGAGDWRAARLVTRGHDVNHPLLAAVGEGPVGSRGYVTLEPAGDVVLAALKAGGNPHANGLTPDSSPGRVTARVYQATGSAVTAELGLWAEPVAAHAADLIERAGGEALVTQGSSVRIDLDGAGIRQALVELPAVDVGSGGGRAGALCVEPFQPVYTRYWLHNTGPAPMGNMPVAVHLSPTVVAVGGEVGEVELAVTVAGDLVAEQMKGTVTLHGPEGWRVEPGELDYLIEPRGHAEFRVRVAPPVAVEPGVYWLRARTARDGTEYEDVARLLVGTDQAETVTARVVGGSLSLRPGQCAELVVELENDAASDVPVQAQLVSPWHTWELFPEWNSGVEVPARGRARLSFPVRVPHSVRAGRWWAVVKVAHGGRLYYTEVVSVEVSR